MFSPSPYLGFATTLMSLLTLSFVPSLPTRAEIVVAQTEPVQTAPEWSVNGALDENSETLEDGSYVRVHRFMGQAGQTVTISVQTREFDSYLILLDPEGDKIAENDDGGEGNQAQLVITLATDGAYTVTVQSYESGEKGSYQLSSRVATPEERQLSQAEQLNQQAFELFEQGKYAEAIPLVEEALRIRQQVWGEQHPDVAASLNNLAGLYESMGRYEDALPLFQQSLLMSQSLLGEQHPDVATSLNNLAGLYESMGRYEDALPLYQQSLLMRQSLLGEQHPDVATNLNNLAFLYQRMGRYEDALPLFQDALLMFQSLLGEQHPDVATSLNNLAVLYSAMGRYEDALSLYQQSLLMRQSLLGEQHPDVATNLNNLAFLYQRMGRYEDALPLFQDALLMFQSLLGEQHPLVATSLNNLAEVYSAMGRNEDAFSLYQQSLLMSQSLLGEQHPDVARGLNNLAVLYQRMGRNEDALSLYQQSLLMSQSLLGEQHPDVATSLNSLAVLHYAQGQIDLALKFLQEGLEIEEINLERILSTGSEGQKRQYMETINGTRSASISLHLQSAPDNQQATHLALTTILRRKGRLLDFLAQSQQILRKSLDPQSQQLLAELNQTRTAIANLYNQSSQLLTEQYQAQLTVLSQQEKQLIAQISSHSRQLAQALEPVTVEQVQNRLPQESALVEFFQYRPYNPHDNSWGKDRYAIYVLPARGQPQGVDLGEVEDFQPLLKRFHHFVQDGSEETLTTEEFKQLARQLDEKLMAKVRPLLGNARHLFVAPDSQLNVIPFEALVDETNTYLIETYKFTYLTSGRDLLRFPGEQKTSSPPTLFGAPDFDNSGQVLALTENEEERVSLHRGYQVNPSDLELPSLPGTLTEVQEIAKMLGVEAVWGADAHEAALKQVNRPRILHIATHGVFLKGSTQESEDNTPILEKEIESLLRSGLVLAGVKSQSQPTELENGFFTALEATSLNLQGTQLVVLSACDTGRGDISAGEGIYGLRRALAIAGSESQVISLWKVDDRATQALMVDYYQNLEKGLGRSEALRQVKLSMLQQEEYQHPYYWASFIPSGNWLPMNQFPQ